MTRTPIDTERIEADCAALTAAEDGGDAPAARDAAATLLRTLLEQIARQLIHDAIDASGIISAAAGVTVPTKPLRWTAACNAQDDDRCAHCARRRDEHRPVVHSELRACPTDEPGYYFTEPKIDRD